MHPFGTTAGVIRVKRRCDETFYLLLSLSLYVLNWNRALPYPILNTRETQRRGESNSPGFYNFCERQFMQFSLFSFSVYILTSHSAFGMPINIQWKQSSKKEVEKDIITVHELPYREIVKSGTHLWSLLGSSKFKKNKLQAGTHTQEYSDTSTTVTELIS